MVLKRTLRMRLDLFARLHSNDVHFPTSLSSFYEFFNYKQINFDRIVFDLSNFLFDENVRDN